MPLSHSTDLGTGKARHLNLASILNLITSFFQESTDGI